jgi:hypothetical protein
MANRKISDLTALTAPATGDLLPIVDISEAAAADKNKKITYGELLASAPAGSEAAPSFSFDSDPNTGIYNPAADTLAFVEGGVEALRIDSSGRVGIGTTSPAAILDVKVNSDAKLLVQDGNTTGNVKFNAVNNAVSSNVNLEISASNTQFFNGGTERARIDSSGRVGIGTTAPLTKLEVRSGVITAGSLTATGGSEILRGYYGNDGALTVIGSEYSSGGPVIGCGVKPSTSIDSAFLSSTSVALERGAYTIAGNTHKWYIGANQTVAENSSVSTSEAMRIDSSGRLLVGTSGARTVSSAFLGAGADTPVFQIEGFNLAIGVFSSNRNDIYGPYLALVKSRGTTANSFTLVNNGDCIGALSFNGTDGSAARNGAAISAFVDGTPGANDMPGRLVFSTTADGAASPTERMRIKSTGIVNIANTPTYADNAAATSGGLLAGDVYRKSDGTLMIRY